MPDRCIIDGCGCVHKARWLCTRHYDELRAAPVEVRMDWPTLRDGEPTDWDIERLLASESAKLAQDSATDSANDSARVAELEAECERLRGDLLQVAQHRDRLECERHDAVDELAEAEGRVRAQIHGEMEKLREQLALAVALLRDHQLALEACQKWVGELKEGLAQARAAARDHQLAHQAAEERVTELLAERADAVDELAEVETLLRAIYADVVSVKECERLKGARVVALGLRRVLTSRSEASCQRDGMMHVPRVHLETVASVLSRAADELEPWRTDRDGVVGLMVRASVDHLELLLEGE